jgi:hypothetical protein
VSSTVESSSESDWKKFSLASIFRDHFYWDMHPLADITNHGSVLNWQTAKLFIGENILKRKNRYKSKLCFTLLITMQHSLIKDKYLAIVTTRTKENYL